MLLAFILCFSTLPMTAFAQEADVATEQEADSAEEQKEQQEADSAEGQEEQQEADSAEGQEEQQEVVPVTQKEAEAAAAPGEETSSDKSTTAGEAPDTVDPSAESVSDNDAGTQDTGADDEKKAAVQKVQALIDALPETVTEENAERVSEQLEAIDEAMAELTEEQREELNMTRLHAISEALNAPMTVAEGEHADHPVCGDVNCKEHGGVLTEWKALSCDENGTLTIDGAEWERPGTSYQLPAGNYYLEKDISLPSTDEGEATYILIKDDVNLCLNGHSITKTGKGNTIRCYGAVYNRRTFSLCDCHKDGENGITCSDDNNNGTGVYVGGECSFNMYGGTISGQAYGVDGYGNFNMYGGKITNNQDGVRKEGSYGNDGIINIHGGVICENQNRGVTVLRSEASNVCYGAILNMTGGEIRGNGTGGVYMNRDITFNMSGGAIIGNNDSGVYTDSYGTFNMTGGKITGNSADKGAGVYMMGTFNMTGGEISGNNTAAGGGSVYVDTYSAFTVSGTAKIQDNWIGGTLKDGVYVQDNGQAAGNVYLTSYKKITIGKAGLKTDASIGVTYADTITTDTDVTVATGADNGWQYGNITSDDPNYKVWQTGNDVKLTATKTLQEHPICGGICTDGSHGAEMWKGISTFRQITSDGNYYLMGNVELMTTWYCDYNVKLCLNGFTITGASGKAAINVKNGKSLDITDCQESIGKITHASGGGCVIMVNGTLTLWNGDITGNNAVSNGGGVYVSSGSTFTMNGGTITKNDAGSSGGGVYVSSGSTFAMNGGTIAGNNAGSSGGGVYLSSGSTFTMNGGTITGNNAGSNGGGVCLYSGSTFTMNGGIITGNNSTNNSYKNIYSGGVYVNSSGSFIVSGEVNITNNWKNGTQNDAGIYEKNPDNADSKAGNVYLAGVDEQVATITIGAGLTEKAKIGVSKSIVKLDEGKVYIIATGATDENKKYNEIFTSDVPDKYFITSDGEGNLYLSMHQHSLTYVAGADGKTITAICEATGCPNQDNGGSVTIAAPDQLTYDGSAKKATVSASDDWLGKPVDEITITYEDESGNKITEPINAGKYIASIALGDATASVTYTIGKATPTADDFTFTAPNDIIYDGNAKEATVKVKDVIKDMGDVVAVKYYQGETVVEPINAGTYTVKIDVEAGANYNAAKDLTSDSWRFTIERSSITPKVELSGDMIYTGNQITPDVTVTIGNKTLTKGTDYTIEYGDNVAAGENAGSVTIKAATTGNYAFADFIKNFDIEKAEQTLNFDQRNVTKTFIDKPFSNILTHQVGDGTVTYSSSNTNVATVNKTTGEVTIVGVGTATITATAAATMNYKEGSASYTLTVNKALLVVNGTPVVQDKYYDGTADAVVTVSFADGNNALLKLKPTTDYTVTGTFSSPNASTSKQEVSIKIELKGDYAKNYELKEDTYTAYAYINAKPISIVSATAVGREYKMGDTSVTISDVTFKDAIPGTLTEGEDYTVTGEMADADAGTKNVTVKVTLRKEAANNYIFEDDKNTTTTTVEISKATPVITAATWKTLMNNGIAVDISDWATFNNTDGAKLIYKLWDAIPEGVTLDENNMLKAENTVSDKRSFAIEVTAEATKNFEKPETQYITVQVVNKITVGVEVKGVPDTVTYGDPDFSLTADFDPKGTVPAEGDNGTWNWSSDDNNILEIQPSADGKTAKIHVKNAGTVMLTVTYTSDTYIGVANISITVNPKAITADMIGNIDAQEYTGKDIKPTPEVKDGTTKLTNDTDFTYSYSNNRNAGTATLTITGKGNYEGEVTKEFTISPKSIDGASIELANKSFAYTGSEQTVNITSVKLSDGTILGTDDYVIKDNSNKATNAGEITLTIEGKGNYTETATTTWEITKAVPKLADFDVVPDLSNELTYSGEEQIVNVTAKAGIRGMGMITVRYNGSTEKPVNVGSYAITIDVADGSNYKAISSIEAGTLTIKKAAAPTLADVKVDHAYATTGNQTVSLAELVKSAKSYTPGEITGNTETEILSDINVTGDGVLQYTLTGKGTAGSTVTIPVTIASTNYEETTVNVVITIKQATPTGAPGYEFLHDSSKTLKDAGLDLINSTLNPKEGKLEWIDSNGKVLPGETKLEEGKKYIWRFTPDDPNYATITGELELYAPYRILDGADSTWTQSTDGTIAIRGNGDFEKFQSVKVDGIVVDAKNYTVAKGSTIITFKGDYLKTLSTGSHTFELVWTDGSAATNFTIAAKPDNGDNNNDSNDDSDNDITVNGNVSSGNNTVPAAIGAPKTGDASGIWMTLFAVSLAGLAAMLVRKKNNRE